MFDPVVIVLAPVEVLPLLTGQLALPEAARDSLARWGRMEAMVLADEEPVPVAELEAAPGDPGWRLVAVACDGPRHPGRPRFRAMFARLRALTAGDDGPCPACGGTGWLAAADPAAHGVILRAAGFRMWRGVPLPAPAPSLRLAAERDMLGVFLSMGSPPPVPTERPPGARASDGPGAPFSSPAQQEAPRTGEPGVGTTAAARGEEE